MTEPTTALDKKNDLSALRLQLTTGSEKVQSQLLQQLATLGEAGEYVLREFLLQRRSNPPSWVDGKAYQLLYSSDSPSSKEFLKSYFPTGIVSLL